MPHFVYPVIAIGLIFLLGLEVVAQENWTRFRGDNGSGVVAEAKLPTTIDESKYVWKRELSGKGSSSPTIWGERLFITSCDSKADLTVHCLNVKNGEELWSKKFESKPYRIHKWNSFASSTPAVDANHVYVTFASPERTMLVALDHEGKVKWERDFGRWQSQHGFSASPIVYKDKVILFNSQQAERLRGGARPGQSRLTAVLAKDGSNVWETKLTTTRACYAVPTIYQDANGKDQIVSCNTGDGFFGMNPETGKQIWAGLPFRMRTVAATLIADGLIIGSNGSGGGGNYLVAIKPEAGGGVKKVYELQKANYVPSPIAVDGKLFLFTDRGVGRCCDLQTGKVIWEERICAAFSGSPVATSDHIYLVDPEGMLYVIAVADEFDLVSKADLGEPSRSTPAIVGDRMFLRTESHVICVGDE